MSFQRYLTLLCSLAIAIPLAAQSGPKTTRSMTMEEGLETTAKVTDWEEINFEFNSHILSDGYPSLLRLAELLRKNPGYRVKVEGNTDWVGGSRYNESLALKRANTVKTFLVKYGANGNQITTSGRGLGNPKKPNSTKEGRFVNRRVTMTVTDDRGNVVGDGTGSVASAINSMVPAGTGPGTDSIMNRLNKLDEIADLLRGLKSDNDGLRKELADLRAQHNLLDQYVKGMQKPLTSAETAQIVDARTSEALEKARMPAYSTLNWNVGADNEGRLTFTGRGRYFKTFKESFAVQAQGEYMYFRDRMEGQFDLGLVNRFSRRLQAGGFASFKHVDLRGYDGGLLGQASFTLDYLFSRGKVGLFGSKGFLNESVIKRVAITRNVFDETYLRLVDQIGGSGTVGLYKNTYMEGNIGFLKSRQNDNNKAGGTVRFVAPITDRLAFTVEGGFNETLISRDSNGRVVAGLQFGNFIRPKDYLDGVDGKVTAVPVDIPRVRYEMLTRRVRTGNDAPVADAGVDQIGIAAGNATLDGSNSYDPDGDPITYQWTQIAGPAVSLTGANTVRATFTAVAGASYAFRLAVRDDKGLTGLGRTQVTVAAPAAGSNQEPQIIRFQASPASIRTGGVSIVDWQVLNADSVTITDIAGPFDAKNGSREVRPTRTTTYRLTARNRTGEVSATTTVTVDDSTGGGGGRPVFSSCQVTPTNITAGEAATIIWATQNVDSVTIAPGVGTVPPAGSRSVSPTENTTYTLTATGAQGTVTCNVTVNVGPGNRPRVVRFTAAPSTIDRGQRSNLLWVVEGADAVSIDGIGTVEITGTREVTPPETTTYTLRASNRFGETISTTQVAVNTPPEQPRVGLSGCSANPGTSPTIGGPVVLSWRQTNAVRVTVSPFSGNVPVDGPVTVNPTVSTTYTVVAFARDGSTATCSIPVQVPVVQPPTAVIAGPAIIETINRQLVLDASQSKDPQGLPLTFTWEPLFTGASVLDQGQPITRVQIGGLFGEYPFRLTVRNSAGASATATVTVRFRSTTVQ